jgi:hypothetical protein
MELSYLTRQTLRRDHFLPPVIIQATIKSIAYHAVISKPRHPLDYLAYPFAYPMYLSTSVNVSRT